MDEKYTPTTCTVSTPTIDAIGSEHEYHIQRRHRGQHGQPAPEESIPVSTPIAIATALPNESSRPSQHEDRLTPLLVWYSSLACAGAAYFGYTSGMIGGCIELLSFRAAFGLPPPQHASSATSATTSITSNILSFIYIGTIPGSLLIIPISSRWGPRMALALSGSIYVCGSALQTWSYGNISAMYIGRIVAGIGMGGSTSIAPMYISEISPAGVRGILVGLHEIAFQVTAVVGFWINYGTTRGISDTNDAQWMVPLGVQIVPGVVLILAALIILPESPRFLVRRGKVHEAQKVLARIRNVGDGGMGEGEDSRVMAELGEIIAEFRSIVENLAGSEEPGNVQVGAIRGMLAGFKGVFSSRDMAYRVLLGSLMMLFLNLTGTVSLLAYSPLIFRELGFNTHKDLPLLLTGIFGAVKGVSSLISSIFFVDRWGRKPLLISGAVGCSLTMWYLGAFLTISPPSPTDLSASGASTSTPPAGILALISVYLFAVFFCLFSQVPWIYCAEIFPTHLRTTGVCITTAVQFAAELLVAKATPYMFTGIGGGGTFFFFAACTAVMIGWVVVALPETKGIPLEEMGGRFKRSSGGEERGRLWWWQRWGRGQR